MMFAMISYLMVASISKFDDPHSQQLTSNEYNVQMSEKSEVTINETHFRFFHVLKSTKSPGFLDPKYKGNLHRFVRATYFQTVTDWNSERKEDVIKEFEYPAIRCR